MGDMSFDAVVLVGGHHATIIANYLQNAGLETAVLERLHELGGGACGDELPVPRPMVCYVRHIEVRGLQ